MERKLKHTFGYFVNIRSPTELGRGRNKYVSEKLMVAKQPLRV